jgi:hypothetical protein
MRYFKDYLRISAAFKDFSLDEYEIAALLQMSLLKYGKVEFKMHHLIGAEAILNLRGYTRLGT